MVFVIFQYSSLVVQYSQKKSKIKKNILADLIKAKDDLIDEAKAKDLKLLDKAEEKLRYDSNFVGIMETVAPRVLCQA